MKTLKKIFTSVQLPHVLLVLSLIGIVLNIMFPLANFLRLGIFMIFIIFYVVFSLVHHYFDKSLTPEVMLEYILLAGLALALLLMTLRV